jgi:hypothetical protein
MQTAKLSILASRGCYFTLTSLEVKGARVRDQAKIMRALKADCMNMTDSFNGDFKDGDLALDDERWKYLRKLLDERLEKGVAGVHAEGVDELCDIVDNVLLAIREEEKKAEEAKKAEKKA